MRISSLLIQTYSAHSCLGGSSGLHLLAGRWSARRYSADSGDGGGLISPEVSPQSKGGFSRLALSQGEKFTAETYLSSFVSYQDGMEGRSARKLAGFLRLLTLSGITVEWQCQELHPESFMLELVALAPKI